MPNNVVSEQQLQSVASAAKDFMLANANILNSVPASVNGGLWYEIENDTPVIKLYYGGSAYNIANGTSQSISGGSSDTQGGGGQTIVTDTLKVYLPFNDPDNPINDLCGNSWTVLGSGTPAVSNGALRFNGNFWLNCPDINYIGGQDFTIACWLSAAFAHEYEICFYFTDSSVQSHVVTFQRYANYNRYYLSLATAGVFLDNLFSSPNVETHVAIVYSHSDNIVKYYENGHLVAQNACTLDRTAVSSVYIGNLFTSSSPFKGSMRDFRFYDGLAFWTDEFTPPN